MDSIFFSNEFLKKITDDEITVTDVEEELFLRMKKGFERLVNEVEKDLGGKGNALVKLGCDKLKESLPELIKSLREKQIAHDIILIIKAQTKEKGHILNSLKTAKGLKLIADGIRKHGNLIGFYSELLNDEKHVQHLQEHWEKAPALKDRLVFFSAALQAHQKGDYIYSVPLFQIHLNAIFDQITIGQEYATLKTRRASLRKKLANHATTSGLEPEFLKSSALQYLCDEVLENSRNKTNNTFPNRHEILHGDDLSYYETPNYSIRSILLTDAIGRLDLKKFSTIE